MFIYQYIDVKDHLLISEKIFHFLKEKTSNFLNCKFWNFLDKKEILKNVPELETTINEIIPIDITMISFIVIKPDYNSVIHVDNDRSQRVLWPIKNCQGSYTNFYNLNNNKIKTCYTDNNVPYLSIDEKNEMLKISQVELVKPIIFDSSIPHNITVNPIYNEPRVTLTIGFKEKNLQRFLHP